MPMYSLYDDEFSCVFMRVDPDDVIRGERRRWIDFEEVTIPADGDDRGFLIAAAVVHIGERAQRGTVLRKIKRGTRNITNRVGRPAWFLGLALKPKEMASAEREEKSRMMREFQLLLSGMIEQARGQLKWQVEVPSRWSYVINDDVIDAADEAGCEGYFAELAGQRFFAADLAKIEAEVSRRCPAEAGQVMKVLKGTKTDEHLSMISLAADEQGALYVTLVDPKGHHLKVEADRFVEMIDSYDEARRLHVFPERDSGQKPPFAFNDNKRGEIVGRFLPEQMMFDIVCCQGQGAFSNIHDRAWFYVDPEYLLCLWLVLCRLEKDRHRYLQLKSKAEARVAYNPFAAGASL